MGSDYFVEKASIVRQIWGKSDTVLVIFAGAAGEFALNKAVDWLYFTGRLPADPIGRLFSTVSYARQIVFSRRQEALAAIDKIAMIHQAVEGQRQALIPDWAYRDVLFMLIDYSIRAFELLERPLSTAERQEVFEVFYRVGSRMGIEGLPFTYDEWQAMRHKQLGEDLEYSQYTEDLYRQYRNHLGLVRYRILRELQQLVLPGQARQLLGFQTPAVLRPVISLYKLSRRLHIDRFVKGILLPAKYKSQIVQLDIHASTN